MSDLFSLFNQYGYTLALIGFFGTLIVGFLKVPLNKIFKSKISAEAPNGERNFDVIACITGFLVATLLGATYTILLVKTALFGEPVVFAIDVLFTNIIGAWMFQTLFYQIYKKLGLKALLQTIGEGIRSAFDKNRDGSVSVTEAVQTIQDLLKDGKINEEEVKSIASEVAVSAVAQITKEAGESATIDQEKQLTNLVNASNEAIATIPSDKVRTVAKAAVDFVEEKSKDVVTPNHPKVKF